MQVAIGLPKFLLESENNGLPTLVVTFLFLIILIPGAFFWCYTSSQNNNELQQVGASGNIFYMTLNEQILFTMIPKIMSLSLVWETCTISSPADAQMLDSLRK